MTVLEQLESRQETLWINPKLRPVQPRDPINGYGFVYMKAAQNRFMRFLPYIASAFPETREKKGIIESPLIEIAAVKDWMNSQGADNESQGVNTDSQGAGIRGRVFLKDDARLPIAGSIKARGGIHEVLKIAESLAQSARMLKPTDNYGIIDSDRFRDFYSGYTIQVGSTGNLGISIGRSAARLGFRAIVHMSSDARQWKKDLLRSEGVIIKEYDGDYSQAVAQGRRESEADERSFFVDDENSEDLFFGYSTAAMRVSVQLRKLGIPVDQDHPLFLYLPCGVGGAPGWITFGFKQMFGRHVHCFFAEPVEAPCMLLGMVSGRHEKICVQDIGLSGRTVADGLAVGRPSGFVCRMMEEVMSGAFTVTDEKMLLYQKKVEELAGLKLEPSACAGFAGLYGLGKAALKKGCKDSIVESSWKEYIDKYELEKYMDQATHIVWGTGGGLMPE